MGAFGLAPFFQALHFVKVSLAASVPLCFVVRHLAKHEHRIKARPTKPTLNLRLTFTDEILCILYLGTSHAPFVIAPFT
jgi:hypothetical protein